MKGVTVKNVFRTLIASWGFPTLG